MSKYELVKFETAEALAQAAARDFLSDIAGRQGAILSSKPTATRRSSPTERRLAVGLERGAAQPLPSCSNSAPGQTSPETTVPTDTKGIRPGGFSVALSGGRIAGSFFSAVTVLAQDNRAGLESVEFFWGDERCVPPEDPESNFRLAWERMLLPLAIPPERVHRIKGEVAPEQAAREAEAELRFHAPSGARGQPVLDLVLLGMGEDGHVASLFPGELAEMRSSPSVFRAVIGPKPPPSRVTMGYATIAAARQVWVLASGAGKERALEESLSPRGETPLAHVLKLREGTRVLTDLVMPGTTAAGQARGS